MATYLVTEIFFFNFLLETHSEKFQMICTDTDRIAMSMFTYKFKPFESK
jgi:hypothetical protein